MSTRHGLNNSISLSLGITQQIYEGKANYTYMYLCQSQVENEHYSCHFLTTFLSSHCCNSVSKPPGELKLDVQ